MSGKSLGLIETVGLAAAIEAADAALKSANVQLVGYELTKGDGMITVKFEGEVGAINAAVAAGVAAASKVSKVFAYKVIARTAEYIDNIIHSANTIGIEPVNLKQTTPLTSLEIPVVMLKERDTDLSCTVTPEVPTHTSQNSISEQIKSVPDLSKKKRKL